MSDNIFPLTPMIEGNQHTSQHDALLKAFEGATVADLVKLVLFLSEELAGYAPSIKKKKEALKSLECDPENSNITEQARSYIQQAQRDLADQLVMELLPMAPSVNRANAEMERN